MGFFSTEDKITVFANTCHLSEVNSDLYSDAVLYAVLSNQSIASNQTVRIYVKRYIDTTSLGTSYHFGGQVNAGTIPTSYIPTTTVPMDRVADVLHYDVGDVITQGQGILYCEFNYTGGTGVVRKVINLSDGTIAERITLYINTINGLQVIGVTGGVTTIDTPTVTYAVSGNNKILLTYRDNSVVAYHNGSLAGSDFSGLISRIFTKIHVGVGQDGLSQLNNEIGNIKYYKEVLTEAEAIKITTI